jgi:hypothetical protein
MVTFTTNIFNQFQNYTTKNLEVFLILLLIQNSKVFLIFAQLWSLTGNGNMSLPWTLKSFTCVQGRARAEPSKKGVVYINYT